MGTAEQTKYVARALIKHAVYNKRSTLTIKIVIYLKVLETTNQMILVNPPHVKYINCKASTLL